MKIILYPLLIGILIIVNLKIAKANEIIVSNLSELQNAINNAQGGDTISLLTGT